MPGLPIIKPKTADQDLRLINSAKHGDINAVRKLIIEGVDLNDADAKGDTALIYASMAGHLTIVLELLEAGADPKIKSEGGWDAYKSAMFFGEFRGMTLPPYDEIMKAITDYGYDSKVR